MKLELIETIIKKKKYWLIKILVAIFFFYQNVYLNKIIKNYNINFFFYSLKIKKKKVEK